MLLEGQQRELQYVKKRLKLLAAGLFSARSNSHRHHKARAILASAETPTFPLYNILAYLARRMFGQRRTPCSNHLLWLGSKA